MHNSKRIIVIGGNAAGPSAAAKAKRFNPSAEVILIESGMFISTGNCELPYLLSGEIDDYSKLLFYTPDAFLKEKLVNVLINHFVKSIDAKRKEIEVLDKRTNTLIELEYDKLILTTGSKPNELSELPFELENVFSFKSVSDYLRLKTFCGSNPSDNVLIVGSGYIGLEVVESLRRRGKNVTILDESEYPLPSADEEIRLIIADELTKYNIDFINKNARTKFILSNNRFSQLKHEGRYLDFDFVIVAVGITPNNSLAETANLKVGKFGGLIVDSRLKTSNPNIYAAGDNIEITNRLTNRNDYFPLATYAHKNGHIAGENAAGGNKIAEPLIFNSSFKLFDKFISQVGLSWDQAKNLNINSKFVTAIANNKVRIMPNSSKVFGKVVYDNYSKLVLGASFIGSVEVSGYADLISSLIYNKNSVLSLAKQSYNYTPPLSPFINLLSILGRKIEENI